MNNKLIDAKEAAGILGISEETAKSIILTLNSELKSNGYMVVEDKCSVRYLEERFYIRSNDISHPEPLAFSISEHIDSVYRKAYDFLLEFICEHRDRFVTVAGGTSNPEAVIGEIDTDIAAVFILKSAFDEILTTGGYDPSRFLRWAKGRGLIAHKPNRNTMVRRIKGVQYNCVCIYFQNERILQNYQPISRFLH